MGRAWDVVVVGAGPAGSASALLLARAGFSVLLLEKAHFPRAKACAEFLSPGTVDMLSHLGCADLLPRMRALQVPGMDIISPRGARLRLRYDSPEGPLFACTLPRLQLDSALAERAVDAGAHLQEGFAVRQPLIEDGVVTGVRGSSPAGSEDVRARLVIVADGGRSSLGASVGLARKPRWPVRLGLVAHFEGKAQLRDGCGEMHVRSGGYCGVAPLPDSRVNVAVVVRADSVRRSSLNAGDYLDEWIRSSPALAQTLAPCWRTTRVRGVTPIGSRSRRAWMPGCLLVGDAASFFDPFTGEGIYRALKGAELAAQIAAAALTAGSATGQALAPYDSMRTRAFRQKTAVTALVQLFVQYPTLMEYALPRLSRRTTPRTALSLVLGDVIDAGNFLQPRTLWSALRP